ncbi:nitroreductase family deazaflavin-dependent oxidoreductase [Rhodococcus erythropolis]
MDIEVPKSLRYRDGEYALERFPGSPAANSSLRVKRIFTRSLRAVHRPWFAVWMPTGVAELTTIGRKSGKERKTFVRANRVGEVAYLVSITGEHSIWLKNIRANPQVPLRFRRESFTGVARDLGDDSERQAIDAAFCGRQYPFDYVENFFHRQKWPTRTKIIELHRAWLGGGTPLIVESAWTKM